MTDERKDETTQVFIDFRYSVYVFSFVWDSVPRGRTGGFVCRFDAVSIPQSSLTGRGVSTQRYCGGQLSYRDLSPSSFSLTTFQTPFRFEYLNFSMLHCMFITGFM